MAASVATPAVQDALRQGTVAAAKPSAGQVSAAPQTSGTSQAPFALRHWFPVAAEQMPTAFATLQAWQSVVSPLPHALLQHTPSTQKLFWQKSFAAQGWPFPSFGVHVVPRQKSPATQLASLPAQPPLVPLQTVPAHTCPLHDTMTAGGHVVLPLHVAPKISCDGGPLLQLAARQTVLGAAGSCCTPPAGVHESVVQTFPSSTGTAVPWHAAPLVHVSPVVHALLSSQDAPVRGAYEHVPLLQTPGFWH